MITPEKAIFTTVVGIVGICVAAEAARLVLELAKKRPEAAKIIVNAANEAGNFAADNISTHLYDKPAIEVVKKGKDILAEMAKYQLDEHHNYHKGWK